MEKIFYTQKNKFPSTEDALRYILPRYFDRENAEIYRNENGKPYLTDSQGLFFSVSHTKEMLFLAFSDENVGIDAELLEREIRLELLLKRFPQEERLEIFDKRDFLRHWVVKESAVKWLGGTLARDLDKLLFYKNELFYNDVQIPVFLTLKEISGHILCVCGERNFEKAEIICF